MQHQSPCQLSNHGSRSLSHLLFILSSPAAAQLSTKIDVLCDHNHRGSFSPTNRRISTKVKNRSRLAEVNRSKLSRVQDALRDIQVKLSRVEDALRDIQVKLSTVEDALRDIQTKLSTVEDALRDIQVKLSTVEDALRDIQVGYRSSEW
ncbi:methyl-accepting chemotaxis domain-containing protein [Elysia marginata]|uniref:Methyl-accepting chemotaxis domain-containing protein n=1 Tax=Elysia marginata TaxID=1093978 RepID=A0AAV4H8K1_9GAST|nr:methyl-accepting chemotaxis domain-containing protein [Elysia marginata]